MAGGGTGGGRCVRIGLGLALMAAAGTMLALGNSLVWWVVGGAVMADGVLLVWWGLRTGRRPKRLPAPRLGDLLVKKGWVTEGQLAEALVRHHQSDRSLGRMLVEMKLITPSQLTQALREQQSYEGEGEERPDRR